MSDTTAPRSWKLGCKDRKGDPWAYNALRFATKEECQVYGDDLSMRWLALVEWEPHPSDDPVNRKLYKRESDGRWVMEDVKEVS